MVPLFGILKLCGIISLWDEECFGWMRLSAVIQLLSWLVLEEIQWIIQALVDCFPWHRYLSVSQPWGCSQGQCPGGLQSCWQHTRKLGGMIPELLVKHCAPHPAVEQFQDCITSPVHGVQAPSVLFSTWVLLIRRNMLGNLAFTKNVFSVRQPTSFHSPGSLSPPLLNLQSQPVSAVAAGIET